MEQSSHQTSLQDPSLQLAADKNDLNEETIDGKNTTHATTMVVYQRKGFGPELPPTIAGDHSERRRSLKRSGSIYELQECSAHGRRPAVTQYTGAVDMEWLRGEGSVLSDALHTDDMWALLRIKPAYGHCRARSAASSKLGWIPTRSCILTFLL